MNQQVKWTAFQIARVLPNVAGAQNRNRLHQALDHYFDNCEELVELGFLADHIREGHTEKDFRNYCQKPPEQVLAQVRKSKCLPIVIKRQMIRDLEGML